MRNPNKSRSRNKNSRRNNSSGGNALNRVHDSSGPDGRVRGTPQQVIEKYQALAHDSSLSGDRVAMENFQQHAEHYIRLTNEAQRQINERRQNAEQQQQDRQAGNNNQQPRQDQQSNAQLQANDPGAGEQPSAAPDVPKDVPFSDVSDKTDDAGGLVETPEAEAATKRKPQRSRKPRPPKNETESVPEVPEQPVAE